MHQTRRRKANGLSGQTCDPCAQRQMCSFNLLGMFFPDRILLREEIPLIGPPIVGRKPRHTTWRSALLQFYEHGICRRSQDIREDCTTVRVNRMPPPPLVPLVPHITPHLVPLSLVDWLDDDVHVLWRAVPEARLMHIVPLGLLFFNVFITVVGLTFNTRAVSRLPRPFRAISTIWVLTSCKNPLWVYSRRNVGR